MPEDKGLEALEKFHKECTEDNPKYVTLLARVATEAYIANTERDGSAKSEDAGKLIYDAMFNYLKDEVYGFSSNDDRGRQRIEEIIRGDLGINGAVLEDVIKKGIDLVSFNEGIVKASMGNLSKVLDKLGENTLTPECMTESAKRYLAERAKKLELRGLEDITEEKISSIEDFRYIAKKIAENKRGA